MIKARRNNAALSRRAFLKHSGALATMLSPFIPTLNLEAQEASVAKRIIFFNSFNGTIADEFFPDDTGRDFTLKRILNPLQDFREKMTILGNVNMDPAPGGAHTGQGMLLTNTIPNDSRQGMGISVDQYIANQIGGDTPFSSFYLGNVVQGGSGGIYWRGAADEIDVEDNAYRSFDRLFGDLGGGQAAAQRLADRRRSVIDGVLSDLNSFRSTLPADDKQLVDLHLDSLRTLEQELSSEISCAAPAIDGSVDTSLIANMPETSVINNQIAVSALRCGLTRVIGMPFLRPVRNHALTFLGQTDGLHDISHDGVANSTEKYTVIQEWYGRQLADLCQRLAAVPEGSGTMLDNTLIVWSNPLRSSHTKTNLPILMIGGGWYFDMGQFTRYSSEPHGKWLVSLCHAMGVNVSTFGETDTSQGPLSGITI